MSLRLVNATDHDCRDGRRSWGWLRAALVGIGICGLIGPVLPLLVTLPAEAFNQKSSILNALSALRFIPYVSLFAVVAVGPAGALLGALGALWIRHRSRKLDFRHLLLETALAGLMLGALVPLPMFVAYTNQDLMSLITLVLMGAGSGISCASLVFLTMNRLGLLLGGSNQR